MVQQSFNNQLTILKELIINRWTIVQQSCNSL